MNEFVKDCIALLLCLIMSVTVLCAPIHARLQVAQRAVDAVITIRPSGRTVHLVDDDGNEAGSFTLDKEVTITFKRAEK